jgi:hypothetical protein
VDAIPAGGFGGALTDLMGMPQMDTIDPTEILRGSMS